jgi:hypothetical protein
MVEVYKAHDPTLGRWVALKVLKASAARCRGDLGSVGSLRKRTWQILRLTPDLGNRATKVFDQLRVLC